MASSAHPAVPSHVPMSRVRRFDFQHDAGMTADPWAGFSALNDGPDLFFAPDLGGYWVVTRKELIDEVMSSPDRFSSAFSTIPRIDDDFRMIPPNLDPPDHAKYRKIIAQRIFSVRALATIEDDARLLTRQLIAKAEAKRSGDFMADFARPLPIAVFLQLMGMPRDRLAEFSHSIECFFRGEDAEQVGAARMAVYQFAQDWLDSDPATSDSPILRELKAAEIDGEPLTASVLSNMVLTLFMAGLDTVAAQMGHVMHFLATHSPHQRSLSKNPALIADAIEEMLRRFGIANLARMATDDMLFHGVEMKRGDLIMVSSAMAGLDEAAFADASTVDFGRRNIRKHSAFGAGIHLCPGAYLARTQLRVLLEEMLPRFANLRLQPGVEIEYLPGTIMSLRRLPLCWDPPAKD